MNIRNDASKMVIQYNSRQQTEMSGCMTARRQAGLPE